MKIKTLDGRLSVCADFVRPGSRIADIGTDHGLLPVWLIREGIAAHAIACDLREAPLSKARLAVENAGLTDKIETRLSDGLANILHFESDDIIIAGMGGELIVSIIRAAEWLRHPRYRLILQPMTNDEKLRDFLCGQGFEISEERAAVVGKHVYTVMRCEYSGKISMPDALFLLCGRLIHDGSPEAMAYLQKKRQRLLTKARGLERAGKAEQAAVFRRLADEI